MTYFMVRFDGQLARTGELVYSEVFVGSKTTLVDRHGGLQVLEGSLRP